MTMVAAPEMQCVAINDDAQFLFPPADEYWYPEWVKNYEPELAWVLRRAADRPYAFVDAGANYGYWSVLATSAPYGRRPTVAIEPARTNFEWLVRNAHANGDRFATLRYACLDVSGKRVTLFGKKHYGLSLQPNWHPADADRSEEVESITLDDIADRYMPNRRFPAFIKLDVEGSEAAAMQGARRLLEEGALVVYEDHGKEPAHPASRYVLALGDMSVWHVGSDMRPQRIVALEQVAAIKVNPIVGYNFFACRRSSPWSSLFEDQ